jgi:hypothetical protein
MQTPGTYISAIGHLGLIGWLIVGWGFDSEPLVFDDISVSLVSGEEFEQMQAATTPEPGNAEPTEPVQPVIDENPPPAPAEEQPTETASPPDPVEPPESEVPPPPPPPAPPATDVTDAPPAELALPVAPPPTPDVEVSEAPTPPQPDRIASTPSAPPPPDAQVDDVVREEVVPDDTADAEVVENEVEPAAPEEAAAEIAIADLAPTTSARPQARPSRLTPAAPEPEEDTQTAAAETQPEPQSNEDDVAAALAAALAAPEDTVVAEAPALPLGQGLTPSESGAFFRAIGDRWTVDSGAESANITVTVRFSVNRDRKVEGEIVLESASEGSAGARDAAFRNARSAILRLSAAGPLPLPADKYDFWGNVRLTFDPSEMRIR